MRQQIIDSVEQAFKIAEAHFGKTFSRPKHILFREVGASVGGYCNYHKSELMFHLGYCKQNPELYIKTTIPHEVAHWIDKEVYGFQNNGNRRIIHGRTWKSIMTSCFKIPADRCMEDVFDGNKLRARRQSPRYKYTCACSEKEHKITPCIHNRIMGGKVYRCRACRCPIKIGSPDLNGSIESKQTEIENLKARIANLQNT